MIKYFCDYCKKEVDAQDIKRSWYVGDGQLCEKCKGKESLLYNKLNKENEKWFTKRKAELTKEIFQDD